MKKYKDFTKEEKEIADKIINDQVVTISSGTFMSGVFGGFVGLGLGLIFLGFLQAIGLSIVCGTVSGLVGLLLILHGPIRREIHRAIGESE